MATSRRKGPEGPSRQEPKPEPENTNEMPQPTGKVFLSEEDKRLLRKFNKHLVNKLGLGKNRSIKL